MARNTSILLGEHFEEYISNKVASGKYSSASEVIRTGLRLLEEEENKVNELRNAIEEGEISGMIEKFDPKEVLKMFKEKYSEKS